MAHGPDPWAELSRLAPNGLDSAGVEVYMKGEPITIMADHMDMAIKQAGQSTRVSLPQGMDPQAVSAALNVVLIEPDEELEVLQKAREGDEKALALWQAIQFRRVLAMRGPARKLLAAYKAKEPRAVAKVRIIQHQATGHGPHRLQARTVLWLLTKDVSRPVQASEPEGEPETAVPAEDTTHGESSLPVPAHSPGCGVYAGVMRCVVGCPAYGKTKPASPPTPTGPGEPQFTAELDGQATRH